MAISSIALSVDNTCVWSGQRISASVAVTSSTTTTIPAGGIVILQANASQPCMIGTIGLPATGLSLTAGVPAVFTAQIVMYDSYQLDDLSADGQFESFSFLAQVITADGGSGTSSTITATIMPYAAQMNGYTQSAGSQGANPSARVYGPPGNGAMRFDSNLMSALLSSQH